MRCRAPPELIPFLNFWREIHGNDGCFREAYVYLVKWTPPKEFCCCFANRHVPSTPQAVRRLIPIGHNHFLEDRKPVPTSIGLFPEVVLLPILPMLMHLAKCLGFRVQKAVLLVHLHWHLQADRCSARWCSTSVLRSRRAEPVVHFFPLLSRML